MIKTRLLQYKFILIALVLFGTTYFLDQGVAIAAVDLFLGFIKEMVQILPPIMILTALIGVWVSRETIVKGFGTGSAWRGRILSLALGTFSAGPIYAAFPAAAMLLSKGASVSNVVIIISTWAVVKLPMLITEASFLGLSFAVTRYILTVPIILVLGWIIEKQVSPEDFPYHKKAQKIEKINVELPQLNCKRCGYSSCNEFAEAILDGYKVMDDCAIIAKKKVNEKRQRTSNKANTPCITLLESEGVAYTLHSYTHTDAAASYGLEAAQQLSVEADKIFKSLVVEVDDNQLIVCIIPVTTKLSMKAVAKAHGSKRVQMADKALVQRTTGYVLGGVSPIGQKKSLRTYIDESAILYETMLVSGGMRGLDVELAVDDLQILTKLNSSH